MLCNAFDKNVVIRKKRDFHRSLTALITLPTRNRKFLFYEIDGNALKSFFVRSVRSYGYFVELNRVWTKKKNAFDLMNSIKSTWVLLPFLPLTLYNVTSMIYFHRFPLCIQKKNICLHCIIYKIHQIIQFQQINTYNIFDLKLYMCTLCMRFHYLWWIFLFGKAIHVYIENNLCLSNEIHFGN